MFPALILALISLGSSASVADAQFEVLDGRVSLAAVDGVFEVRSGEAPRVVRGPGYLEVPPLSRVSIRWHQTGSLVIQGPASFEWSPEQDRVIWRFHQVGRTHMEVRSHQVRVHLPGGWMAAFENGASYLKGRAGGGVEFHHDAGLPVLLSGPPVGGSARPPWTVLAGAKLLLRRTGGRPSALRGTHGRMLEPYWRPEAYARERRAAGDRWAGFSWPWRSAATQPVAARAPSLTRVSAPAPPPEAFHRHPAEEPQGEDEWTPSEPGEVAPEVVPGPGSEATPDESPQTVDPQAEVPGAEVPGAENRELELPESPVQAAETADPAPVSATEAAKEPEPESDVPDTAVDALGSWPPIELEPYVPPARLHPWLEFTTHIRREGRLKLTPYGVRWEEPETSASSVRPPEPDSAPQP